MKKLLSLSALAVLTIAALSFTASAKDKTWTGWISDSICGAKGASAGHKDCAIKCVKERGASWVFVNGKTHQVLKIDNQDAINADNDLGHEVKVTGMLQKDGSLHVASVTEASMMKSKSSM